MNSGKLSIYIHIPFCVSKCAYCSFLSSPVKQGDTVRYVELVKREIAMWSERFGNREIYSVYFGGGTPSLLSARQVKSIVDEIKADFPLKNDAEITLEMNPASGNGTFIRNLAKTGVNRVSVGFQTCDDAILKELNRPHTRADFIATVNKLKRADYTDISADIMLGLPHQNMTTLKRTLEILLQLEIPHISVYALKLEKGTPLYKTVNNGYLFLPDDDESADMYDYAYKTLEENKIYRYEVSNFARVGFECRHNINYWERGEYIGVGTGAHGFIRDVRYSNLRDIEKYAYRISSENKLPVSVRNKLSLKEAEFEFIILALRMDRGLDVDKFNALFYTDFIKRYDSVLKKLEKIGLITYDEHNVAVRPEKMGVLNSLLVEFMTDD